MLSDQEIHAKKGVCGSVCGILYGLENLQLSWVCIPFDIPSISLFRHCVVRNSKPFELAAASFGPCLPALYQVQSNY